MEKIEDYLKILKLSAKLVKDNILKDQIIHIQECIENLKQNTTIKEIIKELKND